MGPSGEDVAVVLLRALPADTAELLLGRIGGEVADRLRARLRSAAASMPPDQLDTALREFFDMQRIAERLPPVPAGTYSPVAVEPPPPAEESSVDALRALPPDQLARALTGESVPTIVLALNTLGPGAAADVLKNLPPETRPEVAILLAKPGVRNRELAERVARAVVEKARRLAKVAPEPTPEDRINNLASMLRAFSRADRIGIIQALEVSDPDLADQIKAKLYVFEDLLRVDDRALQGLLSELDMKGLATALKDADERIMKKVTANISSRSRELLTEEIGLLGSISPARVKEARNRIADMIRQFEEEGKIVLEA